MSTSLPPHRQFLTSLINSLSKTPSSHPEEASPPSGYPHQQQAIPLSRRRLLLTLHVLFPNLLLPALDLLDRSLVTRLVASDASSNQAGQQQGLYLIKSLASTMSRRRRETAAARLYLVQLSAWNCTCASFSLDAFPATVRSTTAVTGDDDDAEGESWAIGGLSLDGYKGMGEDVPCCKHLLAALLGDSWEDVMGSYVQEAKATMEELAGIIAST